MPRHGAANATSEQRSTARRGHRVRAYDFSPDARRATQRRLPKGADEGADEAAVHRLMLDELRTVAVAGAEIGLLDGRRHVYARGLVGCLGAPARRKAKGRQGRLPANARTLT